MIGSYFKGYSSKATTYYRSYNRALLKYVNNGFFARDLDADDFAFIERVRERGCVPCGSLAQLAPTSCTFSDNVISRVALIEEMDFWQQPYQVDHAVVRRPGPIIKQPPRPVGLTPDAIKRNERRAAMAAARDEEVRRAEEKQREQLRRDIEWERAAPKTAPFGGIDDRRRFIPQWKINDKLWTTGDPKFMPRELTAAEQAELDDLYKRRVAARKLAREAADRDGQRLTVQDADEAADRILGIEPERDRQARLAREHAAERDAREAAAEATDPGRQQRLQAAQARAEARQQERQQRHDEPEYAPSATLADAQQRQLQAAQDQKQFIKARILQTMHMTFPRMVTLEALMISTGCKDKVFLMGCAEELCNEGRLNHKTEPAT